VDTVKKLNYLYYIVREVSLFLAHPVYLTPTLSRRTATTTRFSPKAARNRRRQGIANIQSGGLLPHKHSPDGATSTHPIKQPCYSFIDLERM